MDGFQPNPVYHSDGTQNLKTQYQAIWAGIMYVVYVHICVKDKIVI